MRLNRLDLIRYGHFQDASLPFPTPETGPDVTLVYGPNEAGKSTAFEALLDALFGMRGGSHPYAFRHERANLLVGAELDIAGQGKVEIRRNAKRNQSLTDARDRPVDATFLQSALHGLTRDTFLERFSLNDESLRAGGARIAKAEGDLGQLLHAGVSGLTGLAEALVKMETRADAFHKKGSRNSALNVGKKRLTEIAAQLRQEILTEAKEAQLRGTCATADARFAQADTDLRALRGREAAARAAQVWYETSDEIDGHDKRLNDLPKGPDLPQDAAAKITALATKLTEKIAQLKSLDMDFERLASASENLELDPAQGALEAELAHLDGLKLDGAPLIGRAFGAAADLDRRRKNQTELREKLAELTGLLGVSDEAALNIFVSDPQKITDLDKAVKVAIAANAEAVRLNAQAAGANAALGEAPSEPCDITALQNAFEHWSAVSDISVLSHDASAAMAQLSELTSSLPMNWLKLARAGVPSDMAVRHLADSIGESTSQLRQARAEQIKCAALVRETAAVQTTLNTDDVQVDAESVETTRRERDAAWSAHMASLTAKSAVQFEETMHADDAARAHYFAGKTQRERHVAARLEKAKAKAAHETAAAAVEDAEKVCAQAQTALRDMCDRLGLPQETAAFDLFARQALLVQALGRQARHDKAQDALEVAKGKTDTAFAALREAALAQGIEGVDAALAHTVSVRIASHDQTVKTWETWQRGQKQLEALNRSIETARQDETVAQDVLRLQVAHLPLPDCTADALQAVLPVLRERAVCRDALHDMDRRVADMEDALAQLRICEARLIEMGVTPQNSALATLDVARTRLKKAQDATRQGTELKRQLEELSAKNTKKQVDLATVRAELKALFVGQDGAEMSALERVGKLVARDDLRRQKRAANQRRNAAKKAVDVALFEEELAILPNAVREAEIAQMRGDAQDTRDAALALRNDALRAYEDAVGAERRADLVAEAETLREELRTGAYDAAVAQIGARAARGALHRLAEERRGTMLADVERAFVAMTAPKWQGVRVWSPEQGEKLVGVAADGREVPAQNMSTGTMAQLYFALRVAGYLGFARSPGPLPMILDDIMETFDDDRARGALQLCAEIGTAGQAIMFTHHAHLIALARQTLPNVTIVELPTG